MLAEQRLDSYACRTTCRGPTMSRCTRRATARRLSPTTSASSGPNSQKVVIAFFSAAIAKRYAEHEDRIGPLARAVVDHLAAKASQKVAWRACGGSDRRQA
jgi:hypothetical protein